MRWGESGTLLCFLTYLYKIPCSVCYVKYFLHFLYFFKSHVTVHTPLFREVFWHEYAKIPRHTSQNSIAAGNLEWILATLLWTEWTVTIFPFTKSHTKMTEFWNIWHTCNKQKLIIISKWNALHRNVLMECVSLCL